MFLLGREGVRYNPKVIHGFNSVNSLLHKQRSNSVKRQSKVLALVTYVPKSSPSSFAMSPFPGTQRCLLKSLQLKTVT